MMIAVALLLASSGAYYASSNSGQSTLPAATKRPPVKTLAPSTIRLEIVIDGGFAYIPSGNTLNIAYLDDWKYTGANDNNPETPASTVFCDVQQMGTTLKVDDGDIVSPAPTPSEFNLDDTIVTFPALQVSTAALSATRSPRTSSPLKPANANNPADWEDLRFISSLKAEHPASLNPKWKAIVDGFMVLRGGSLKSQKPIRFGGSTFDFRRGTQSKFAQSMSDRTLYTVDVAADQIEIQLETGSGARKIVVKPRTAARKVRLSVTGAHHKTGTLAVGDELKEHCTFYQLFEPVPQPSTWLRPYLMAPHTAVLEPHSPGFFCPGDWF